MYLLPRQSFGVIDSFKSEQITPNNVNWRVVYCILAREERKARPFLRFTSVRIMVEAESLRYLKLCHSLDVSKVDKVHQYFLMHVFLHHCLVLGQHGHQHVAYTCFMIASLCMHKQEHC